MSKLTMKTEGDTQIVITRRFDAPPEAVYRAHTDPKIVQRWLLGPEGWTMPVCEIDARPRGKFRYEWEHPKKPGFYIAGEFVELKPYSKIVHVERMYMPDPSPESNVETTFAPDGSGTLMTIRMTVPDAQTRATMVTCGMDKGMEASYVRLENMMGEFLPSAASR